ncbi:MAG TPA: hybrid sensor histidine kinase/response regulator [Cyanobacteria bacterium UBA11049]|nr:hybrid sensor histidine kinase/response regulator [Cyanobacteria bacterium UBA11049]
MVLRILLIDDNPDDRLLAIRELNRAFDDLIIEEIAEAPVYELAIAAGSFDLVVTDYKLRWNDGISVLRAIKACYPTIPVVMFTNSGDEEVAVEAMKAGLNDYVIKSPKHYFRLPIAVRSALKQARDRTARKQAETRYSELFERVPVGLYRITPEGQILEANAALVQLLGYANSEALLETKSLSLHMDAEVMQQWRERIERDDLVGDFETQLRTHDNRIIWVLHNAKAIRNAEGKVCYYEGAIENITERKQMEQERQALLACEQAARAAAEAASRMKDEFLATLSHELRTPLNAILGWATLLRTRKFNADATARALEIIERNAKAQAQMIEDLLDISRIIRGKLRLSFHPVNLISVLNAAIDVMKPAATAKNISLELLLEPSILEMGEMGKAGGTRGLGDFSILSLTTDRGLLTTDDSLLVLGDANRLQQVFWNLLTNAIKFTANGGKVEVRVSVVMGNSNEPSITDYQLPITSYAQIQVADTGQGITPEFLPYVFDYFRQADSSSTRSQGGLGLGLAIVRQLVEIHGGTVCAESQGDGLGATFTVKIPLVETAEEAVEAEGEKPLATDLLPLDGVRILVVEDEVDTRELMKILLEECGAKVAAASSAAQAKQAIADLEPDEPDIMISDIAMPEEDGYQLMRQLRAQGKQMPAIALTAYARDSDVQIAIAAGFQHHLSKPIEPDALIALVAELVGRK